MGNRGIRPPLYCFLLDFHARTRSRQVVEVSSYTEHLLTECDSADKYKECPRCREAVKATELAAHTKKAACPPAKPGAAGARCALCHKDVPAGGSEGGWRRHLAEKPGCSAHARKPVR